MICTESGCRVAVAADLLDVMALMPALLKEQANAGRGLPARRKPTLRVVQSEVTP